MVVLLHSTVYSHFHFFPLVQNSWMFVDFFFVLSGFVISHAYRNRLQQGLSPVGFMIRRFGRLYPLHLFTLMIFVLIALGRVAFSKITGLEGNASIFNMPQHGPGILISNLLLTHSLGFHDYLAWNAPSWSISVEFYTCFAFIFLVLVFRSSKHMYMALAGVIGASSLFLLLVPEEHLYVSVDYGIVRCLLGFSIGMLVEQLRRSDRGAARFVTAARTAANLKIAEPVIVLVAGVFIILADTTPLSVFVPFLFGLVVWVFSFEAGAVSGVLKHRLPVWLGTLSYSIYMTHSVVILVIRGIFKGLFGAVTVVDDKELIAQNIWAGDMIVLLILVCTLAFSLLTCRWIENPFRQKFNAIADQYGGTKLFLADFIRKRGMLLKNIYPKRS